MATSTLLNINHEWLIEFLEYRINDKVYMRYIKRFLKSGILEQGKLLKSDKGTPQRRYNITCIRKYILALRIR